MGKIIIIYFIFASFLVSAQVSYDFAVALPVDENNIPNVTSSHFGKYESDNKETHYEFDSEGIWIITTIFSSISKETIRESSKYIVRNGYLLGVLANDSIPCFLENDRYHFGMKNREQITGGNSLNILKKINSSTYILNFYENEGFTPSLLTFDNNNLIIQHFDYETGTTVFSSIIAKTNRQVQGMKFITLSPTKKEWKELDQTKLFGSKNIYSLKK